MTQDTSLLDTFPFSSYLKLNYIPSDEEAAHIRTFLNEPRKRLEDMKTEMDRLQATFDSLKLKYDNLAEQVRSCDAFITLPRRLPDDVLQEVFYHTLPTNRNARLCIHTAPWIFTRICRQWRLVALSIPRLLSKIHIRVIQKLLQPWIEPTMLPNYRSSQRWDESRAVAASDWLKRSGDLPLHISVAAARGAPRAIRVPSISNPSFHLEKSGFYKDLRPPFEGFLLSKRQTFLLRSRY